MASRNAFDNIFLSMFLGLNIVTIYGNYYYIMNAISGLLIIATTSIGAGIGNSIATESVEKNYKRLYEVYVYVCMVIWLVYGMFIFAYTNRLCIYGWEKNCSFRC